MPNNLPRSGAASGVDAGDALQRGKRDRECLMSESKTQDVVVFPIEQGASECFADDDPTGILWRAHTKEGSRRGAEFYNYGWVTGGDVILSKTSVGYLESTIDQATMKITHRLVNRR